MAAVKFNKELKQRINLLQTSAFMGRASIYFEDTNYRDLIFKGYTVIYKVEKDEIKILDIFKWQNK